MSRAAQSFMAGQHEGLVQHLVGGRPFRFLQVEDRFDAAEEFFGGDVLLGLKCHFVFFIIANVPKIYGKCLSLWLKIKILWTKRISCAGP